MSSEFLLDAAGPRRSLVAMPDHNAGHAPSNKGRVYPADPPTVDEIVAVTRQTPADRHGLWLRALIVKQSTPSAAARSVAMLRLQDLISGHC
jgi:hypothetical protein